jgi:hypothetical protein
MRERGSRDGHGASDGGQPASRDRRVASRAGHPADRGFPAQNRSRSHHPSEGVHHMTTARSGASGASGATGAHTPGAAR